MRSFVRACAVALSVILVGVCPILAAPLDLDAPHDPLVYSGYVSVSYTVEAGSGDNGVLTASGLALSVNWDPTTSTSIVGSFSLTAEIVPATGERVGGDLVVTDGVSQLFYSGKLDDFGFSAEDNFEFLFEQQGAGMLAPDGEPVGVILWGNSIGLFSEPRFDEPFSNAGNGEADTFWLPEPATAIFLVVGGLGALRHRRRRSA